MSSAATRVERRRRTTTSPPRPASESLLYDLVALGMCAYAELAFRVEPLGLERVRVEPGTILASTHRSDCDVPVLCSSLYRALGLWRRREIRPAFAVRDDLFLPGFFAGYPRGVPAPLRRLLFGASVGGVLRRRLACHPIRSATRMRLVEVLRARPSLPLAPFGEIADELARRAAAHGLPAPAAGREVLRGEYADLLWHHVVSADEELAELWASRATDAAADFRQLVGVLRSGSPLVIFPEGRPSPDGSVGPIMRGVAALARRGGGLVQPLALAYDPLTNGRPRVLVAAGAPLEPPVPDLEAALLDAFRRTLPLTAGEVVASFLGRPRHPPSAGELVAVARAERERGRLVEPALLDPDAAEARVAEAVAAARTASRETLARLACTHESVRER